MKEMKRVLALVLCFVMLVGYLPAGALAAESETVLPAVEAVLGEGVSTWKPQEEQDATEPATEEFVETATEAPEELGSFDSDAAQTPEEDAAVSEEDIANALIEAEAFVKGLMDSNDPQTVVEKESRFFTWDYEKRSEANSKPYLYEWSYYNGVVFEGIDNLYDVTGEKEYSAYVEEYLDAMITDGALNSYAGYVDYHGADCYKTASLLLDYYALTGNEEYKTAADALYTHLQNAKAKYTSSDIGGNYYHTWKSVPAYHLWLDGLYMILPFMAEYAAAYDKAELDLIADRLAWVSGNMYDDQTGLFSHAINLNKAAYNNSGKFWGRAIGWYAAALVDVMDHMEGQNLADMKAQLKKLVDGMIPYQTEDGMWRQFVNVASSTKETSVTALMGYAIMKAVNKGWLAASYAEYANKAFVGICDYALDGTGLHYICHKGAIGDYKEPSYSDYTNEGKGVGPFIMLFAEMEESVYGASAPETPVIPDAPVTPDVIVPTVEGVELTGEILDVTNDETVVAAMATLEDVENFMAFEIPAEQPAEGETATVSVAIPEGWNTDNLRAYYINDASEVAETIEGTFADGVFSFEVSHFSTYAVAEGKLSGDNQITTAVTSIVSGSYYRIVSHTDTTTDRYLSNLMAPASGTGYDADGVNRLRLTTEPHYWYVTQVQGGYTVQYGGPEGQYLAVGDLSTGNNNNTAVEMRDDYTVLQLGYHTGNKAWGVWIADNGTNRYMNHHRPKNNQNTYVVGTWTGSHENGNDVASRWRLDRVVFGSAQDVKLMVSPNTLALHPNDVVGMQATVQMKVGNDFVDQDLSKCSITWSVGDTKVATIAANGTLTAKAAGTTKVKATLTAVDGVPLQTAISVEIPLTVTVRKVELMSNSGTVYVGASGAANTRAKIKTTYNDGTFIEEYVTLDMLSGKTIDTSKVGKITGLTVTYNGQTFSNFTLNVVEKGDMDYPRYPEPGSVMLDKYVADATQFQNTGVAEINLVAAGLPFHAGVDVVLVADLSNSMAWKVNADANASDKNAQTHSETKLAALQASVSKFADVFLAPDDVTGETSNTISMVTFGGYDADHTNKVYDDLADVTRTLFGATNDANVVKTTVNNIRLLSESYLDKQYTGDYGLSFDGGKKYNGNYGNTNYDYAFMETANAIQALKNQYNEEHAADGVTYDTSGRQIYVLFMTDGAPTNYNGRYYQSKSGDRPDVNATWIDASGKAGTYTMGSYNQDTWYEYISGGKYNATTKTVPGNSHYWATQVANITSVKELIAVGFDIDNGGFSKWVFTEDLNRPLKPFMEKLVDGKTVRTFKADSPTALDEIYASLAGEFRLPARNAYYIDEMGGSFDLQMAHTVSKFENPEDEVATEVITLTPQPKITVTTQKIYTEDDVGKNGVTNTMIGQTYGGKTTQEIVTFNAAGTEAYSNQSYSYKYRDANGNIQTATPTAGTNILRSDGVIYGKTFWYNTTEKDKTIVLADGTTATLAAESFRWNIGTITNEQFVMSYYVYLEGAAEGEAEPGTYPTNKNATLYYKNWLDHDANQSVDSPNLAWESASVHYVFYLVDGNGNPVTDPATGQTGPIEKAERVTGFIKYAEILLNTVTEENPGQIVLANRDVLPEGYELYDPDATYNVVVNSNPDESYWIINSDTNTVYVTRYHGGDFSNDPNTQADRATGDGWDLTSTIVYFPVLWIPQALPDVVVIDYGLPVQIGVLLNDVFGTNAKLTGIGQTSQKPQGVISGKNFTYSPAAGLTTSLDLKYGTASFGTNDTEVTYTPDTMMMNHSDKFIYEARFNHPTEGTTYYYADVTVIPATIIYYEDAYTDVTDKEYSFLTLSSYERYEEAQYYRGNVQVMSKTNGKPLENVDERGYLVDEATGVRKEPKTRHPDYGKPETVDYPVDLWNRQIVITNPDVTIDKYGYELDEDGNRIKSNPDLWVNDNDKKAQFGYQAEDRPGVVSKPEYDANNVYGYDQVHENMSMHSMGSAKKVSLDSNSYAVAEFDFYGTGFDVVSVTSNSTGTLVVQAFPYNEDGTLPETATKSIAVDTYYGYNYTECDITYLCCVRWADKVVDGEIVYQKNEDGTYVKDASGNMIPEREKTYIWRMTAAEKANSKKQMVSELTANYDVDTQVLTEAAVPDSSEALNGKTIVVREMYWLQVNDTDEALYQVPVMKIEGMPYGKYRGVITASYYEPLDHEGGYDLYLDAIRIYDPAGTQYGVIEKEDGMGADDVEKAKTELDAADGVTGNLIEEEIQKAYNDDNEARPMYHEVRNLIIKQANFNPAQTNKGAIFIDQLAGDYSLTDYISYGPNNEMYLAKDQAIAFELDLSGFKKADGVTTQVADVQIAMKSANGTPVAVTMDKWTKNGTSYTSTSTTAVLGGTSSSNDRYYSIGGYVNKDGKTMLSFRNTSADNSVLSITNIKITFVEKPKDGVSIVDAINISGDQAKGILNSFYKGASIQKQPEALPEAELEVSTRSASVKVGSSVVVKATTSADVDYLTVNGETVTKFTENQQTGKRSWTATVKAEAAGELTVEVVAYSIGRGLLETENLTVEVTEASSVTQSGIGGIISKLFG